MSEQNGNDSVVESPRSQTTTELLYREAGSTSNSEPVDACHLIIPNTWIACGEGGNYCSEGCERTKGNPEFPKMVESAMHGMKMDCRCEACASIRRDMADAARYRMSLAREPVVWADEATPFTGPEVKELLEENEALRKVASAAWLVVNERVPYPSGRGIHGREAMLDLRWALNALKGGGEK